MFLPYWALNVVVALLSMQGKIALGFHQKYFNMCAKDERHMGLEQHESNDRILMFGWTISLT